ncbi:class I SAM-dependent methyltransferase [Alphaproteobacteria bacterium]|nr:class I SAM-dependent methyltransferase [Alphaproteobacteria bacterium]
MPNNFRSVQFYRRLANSIENADLVKFASDYSAVDALFIKQYANSNFNLLDLGSGTGLVVNKLIGSFKTITAVELFKEFSQFIDKKNIIIINQDLNKLKMTKKFDIITIFGTAHYFNSSEISLIYEKAFSYLEENGILLIKNQFSLAEKKVISKSAVLGDDYYAEYRSIHEEKKILQDIGYRKFVVHDLYTDEANKWDDTHYYAISCVKQG